MSRAGWLAWGGLAGVYWLWTRLQPPRPALILNNSVVLITGASSGIGSAYANAFARRGARVVLAARRADMLDEVRNEIAPLAADVLVVPTDVSDNDQLKALVETTLNHFGRIDVLVNNAGIYAAGPLHTIEQERIRRTVDVDLGSVIVLTSLCLPSMFVQGQGWIVNIASGFGAIASPDFTPYIAAKHGLIAFSNALRREVEGTGVQVVSVLPNWTYSEMITPEVESALVKSGTKLDTAEYVADSTIQGMSIGQQEIYFGGPMIRFGIWVERHFPAFMSAYFRASLTPESIESSRERK